MYARKGGYLNARKGGHLVNNISNLFIQKKIKKSFQIQVLFVPQRHKKISCKTDEP
jgi:hypothetical protein